MKGNSENKTNQGPKEQVEHRRRYCGSKFAHPAHESLTMVTYDSRAPEVVWDCPGKVKA